MFAKIPSGTRASGVLSICLAGESEPGSFVALTALPILLLAGQLAGNTSTARKKSGVCFDPAGSFYISCARI